MSNSVIKLLNTGANFLSNYCKIVSRSNCPRSIFTTATVFQHDSKDKFDWLKYNDKIYPPQDPSEERRPAFVCHELKRVKYSPDKMWYAAHFVRGKSVDEAIRQLKCLRYKGAKIVLQAINEAMEMAVKEHNVEFRSNLWVAESFCHRAFIIKGLRRCAKRKITKIRYRYVNYYIRLEEGQPPNDYTGKDILKTGPYLFDKWFTGIRRRKIIGSL